MLNQIPHINYIAYYYDFDGYGRWNSRLVKALQTFGVSVKAATQDHLFMPGWLQRQEGIDFNGGLTISSLPPYLLTPVPGRHWLLSMVEGSVLPEDWVIKINGSGVERVLVPCLHNKHVFENSGVLAPVSVLPGGTDPDEFPVVKRIYNGPYNQAYPYTFLTFADRGYRKGWEEVWKAFYVAFGGKTSGRKDVRLIIKNRPQAERTTIEWMAKAEGADKCIVYDVSDPKDIIDVYRKADCLALPSRCEGWGMPHREVACMGIPVIAQNYSGTADDIYSWCTFPLEQGKLQPVPLEHKPSMGEWMVADIDELAEVMERCANHPQNMAEWALTRADWIRENQTWKHTAQALVGCIAITEEY